MSAALAPYIEKLDAALAEKNVVTDYLNIAQEKTGLPKRNIVLGELETFLFIFLVVSILPLSFDRNLCEQINCANSLLVVHKTYWPSYNVFW